MAARTLVALVAALLTAAGPPASVAQYSVRRQDPFAALSATLRTRQQAACDGQELTLECPQGTKISIQLVEYGRKATSEQVSSLELMRLAHYYVVVIRFEL